MTATLTETTTPEPTPKPTGLALPCPKCGEEGATIALHLDRLQEPDAFKCCDCEAEFSAADLRAILAKWQTVLAWIDLFPQLAE